jgi:hypothetical protein
MRGSYFVYYAIEKMDVARLSGLDRDRSHVDMELEDRIHQDLVEDLRSDIDDAIDEEVDEDDSNNGGGDNNDGVEEDFEDLVESEEM